jgi:NAD(P)-dependent dehydrogenase (short-subunit alcohol dehydrogenase family)
VSGPVTDDVCIVTGAGSGIGQALAIRFASAGCRVVVSDIEEDGVAATVGQLPDPGRALGVTCDVCSSESTTELRERTLERFGSVHTVCLNAGVAPAGMLLDTGLDVWDWALDVNVRAIVRGLLEFGPRLVDQGHGHVLITASVAGVSDTPAGAAYSASKHAAVGIGAAARAEFAPHGVGVSVLCPGLTKTRIFESQRNRPAGMADPSIDNPIAGPMRDLVVNHGMSPDVVADIAYQAVQENQFLVFTSTDFDSAINARVDAVRQGFEWRDALDG